MKTESRPLRRLLAGLLLVPSLVLAQENALTAARDLRAEAEQAARHGGPLIVMYSRADCRYCVAVRRDYLLPLAADPRNKERLLVRQVDQDSSAPLISALCGLGMRTFSSPLTMKACLAPARGP